MSVLVFLGLGQTVIAACPRLVLPRDVRTRCSKQLICIEARIQSKHAYTSIAHTHSANASLIKLNELNIHQNTHAGGETSIYYVVCMCMVCILLNALCIKLYHVLQNS